MNFTCYKIILKVLKGKPAVQKLTAFSTYVLFESYSPRKLHLTKDQGCKLQIFFVAQISYIFQVRPLRLPFPLAEYCESQIKTCYMRPKLYRIKFLTKWNTRYSFVIKLFG